MSILTDLDPKNARFGADTSPDSGGRMSWTMPLVLFSLAGLGLGAAVYHGGSVTFEPAKIIHPPATGAPEKAVSAPTAPDDNGALTQAALISSLTQDTNMSDDTGQANPLKSIEDEQATPIVTKNHVPGKKTSTSANTTRKKVQKKSQEKNAGSDPGKPSARDVEIITAIVR
jgi:hypothetical protein